VTARQLARALVPVIALAALPAQRPVAAQQPRDTIRLDSVVVTATRLPLPRAAVAAAVTVLTGDLLRARGITTLLEALRDVPGATLVQGGSFGTPASLFLRGGESDYVKVLVDGVAVNDPGGAFDFAHLTTDDVERIEIVRGPASVLYGSDAVAGVVQVFTRPGRGVPRWRLGGGGGTYGSTRLEAEAAGGSERAGFSVAASRSGSDGSYAFNSAYRRDELSGLLRGSLGSRTDARLTLRIGDHVTHFPTDGAGRVADHNQFTTGRQTTVGFEARHILGPRLELRLQLSSNAAAAGYDDRPDGPADTLGFYAGVSSGRTVRRSADLRAIAYLASGTTLTVGGAVERQTGRSVDSTASQYGPFADTLGAARRNGALYAQLVADPGGRLALNLGARVDRNQRSGSSGTYRAGISWRISAGARLRAAVGTALKEPTFYEHYATGFVVGNPDLRPERARSWEVGAEGQLGRRGPSVSATWFSQRFTDLIQYAAVPPAGTAANYLNVAAARASGLEVDGTLALAGGLTARAHYTYLSTAVTEPGVGPSDAGPGFAKGRPLLRRPAHAAGVSLGWAVADATLWLAAAYVGRRDDVDYSGGSGARVTDPAYARLDAAGSLPLLGHRGGAALSATLRIENLLGTRYDEVRGFPARGRTLMAGLSAEGGFR
jgi:vitamin B12 transporter